jgi:transposase
MDDYPVEQVIHQRYDLLRPVLDERLRRLWAAAEALTLGNSGVATVSRITGLSRSTIRAGIKQLEEPEGKWIKLTGTGRVRTPGGGRKTAIEKESEIEENLERLMESREAEEPSPLVWTCKSFRRLAAELGALGHRVSYRTVGNLLHRLGYSFGRSGEYRKSSLADCRKGFSRIARTASAFLENGEPVLSVRFHASPEAATASYMAISGLLSWWLNSGLKRYPRARRIMLAAESAVAGNAWTVALRSFATEVRLEVATVHFPPGTWRWQRSSRQVTCSCSLLSESEGVAGVGADLDLVLSA